MLPWEQNYAAKGHDRVAERIQSNDSMTTQTTDASLRNYARKQVLIGFQCSYL